MTDLKASLLRIMDHKDHWAWPIFGGPTASLDQLKLHFQQEYDVYVRDFPVLLSRIHSRCPVAEVRRDLAENLYEEETGGLSGTGPHPDLFLYMMQGLGFDRREFRSVELLPESQAYRDWLDEATTKLPWVVGAAVVTIFVEGSVHDRREISQPVRTPTPEQAERDLIRDNPLVRYHGLDPRYLKLKRAHARVEEGHRRSAWRIVVDHARAEGEKMLCVEAMERSLELWLAYRDGVARAAGIERQTRRTPRRLGRSS
ncbi:MAG TPA: iron-containing redox enzyme family protein [Candidatus Polarisedimenticolia bacterium]|nr:iron-containing redox enzyme family protein [Candidatus Polarisedimenticolia bacterium]